MFSGKKAAEKGVVHDPASQQPHDLDDPFFHGMFRRELGRPSQKLCRKSDLLLLIRRSESSRRGHFIIKPFPDGID
jgi:hypothetical protein